MPRGSFLSPDGTLRAWPCPGVLGGSASPHAGEGGTVRPCPLSGPSHHPRPLGVTAPCDGLGADSRSSQAWPRSTGRQHPRFHSTSHPRTWPPGSRPAQGEKPQGQRVEGLLVTGQRGDQDTRGTCPHSMPSLLRTVHGALPTGTGGTSWGAPTLLPQSCSRPLSGQPALGALFKKLGPASGACLAACPAGHRLWGQKRLRFRPWHCPVTVTSRVTPGE